MSGLFGGGKSAPPPTPPPPPEPINTDKAEQEAAEKAKRLRGAKSKTILTSNALATEEATTKKSTLGGAT